MTGNVIAALAPIETSAAKNPATVAFRCQMHAEVSKSAVTERRDLDHLLTEHDIALRHQSIDKCNTQPAGQMIVTGARKTQRVVVRRARLIARRRLQRSDCFDAFQ